MEDVVNQEVNVGGNIVEQGVALTEDDGSGNVVEPDVAVTEDEDGGGNVVEQNVAVTEEDGGGNDDFEGEVIGGGNGGGEDVIGGGGGGLIEVDVDAMEVPALLHIPLEGEEAVLLLCGWRARSHSSVDGCLARPDTGLWVQSPDTGLTPFPDAFQWTGLIAFEPDECYVWEEPPFPDWTALVPFEPDVCYTSEKPVSYLPRTAIMIPFGGGFTDLCDAWEIAGKEDYFTCFTDLTLKALYKCFPSGDAQAKKEDHWCFYFLVLKAIDSCSQV